MASGNQKFARYRRIGPIIARFFSVPKFCPFARSSVTSFWGSLPSSRPFRRLRTSYARERISSFSSRISSRARTWRKTTVRFSCRSRMQKTSWTSTSVTMARVTRSLDFVSSSIRERKRKIFSRRSFLPPPTCPSCVCAPGATRRPRSFVLSRWKRFWLASFSA